MSITKNISVFAARLFVALYIALLSPSRLGAVKAVPHIVSITEPDGGKVQVRIFGDERFGYMKSTGGYIVARSSDGFVHYANYNGGSLRILDELYSRTSPAKVRGAATDVPLFIRRSLVSGCTDQAGRLRSDARKNSAAVPESIRSVVLLVQFEDVSFTVPDPKRYFVRFLNEKGFSSNGATGCVSEYLSVNLGGIPVDFDVSEVITLPHPVAYYGADNGSTDTDVEQIVSDACAAAAAAGMNFAKYDSDGDGTIENVAIIYAGYDQAEGGPAESIWARQAMVTSPFYAGGKKVLSYTLSSELKGAEGEVPAGIGIFCHEFAHTLGLMDLYDTNGEIEGMSLALWKNLSVMDEGCYLNGCNTPPYFCAIEREILGTGEAQYIESGAEYALRDLSAENRNFLRLDASDEGEYFLFECRGSGGWDRYVGGSGLAVYHVDKSANTFGSIVCRDRWGYNNINSFAPHGCAVLLADEDKFGMGPANAFYPGPDGISDLDGESVPPLLDWRGMEMGCSLHGINYESGILSFYTEAARTYDPKLPVAFNIRATPFQDKGRLVWKADSYDGERGVWKLALHDAEEKTDRIFYSDTTSCLFTGLLGGRKYGVTLQYLTAARSGGKSAAEFETVAADSNLPYARFGKQYRQGDQLFLALMNIIEPVRSVRWTVNGENVGNDDVFTLEQSGEYVVKIYIGYGDGTTDVITKKITIK